MSRGRGEFDRWAAQAAWHQAKIDILRCSLNGQQTVYANPGSPKLILAAGEALFYASASRTAALMGEQIRSHYEGGSSGGSVRIGPLSLRSGQTRGHLVRDAAIATVIDTGTLYVTSRRVVFQGGAQTRDLPFGKLVGFQHGSGATTFSVSNRQKPVTIRYGESRTLVFQFRLDLALAHFRGAAALDELIKRLMRESEAITAARPGGRS